MSSAELKVGAVPELGATDVRTFLAQLRNRVLRVTSGMRPGHQRLELAIEAFWYEALDATPAVGNIPWRSFARPEHPLRSLLGPIRLMLRSELINSGVSQPDPLTDEALARMLEVADGESGRHRADPTLRDTFRHWLRSQLRMSGYSGCNADLLHEAA